MCFGAAGGGVWGVKCHERAYGSATSGVMHQGGEGHMSTVPAHVVFSSKRKTIGGDPPL